jgi:hypothetical protein
MIKSKTDIALWLISILSTIYLVWSLVVIHQYREDLAMEKERVYSIADQLEFWKRISIEYDGRLDLEGLSKDTRNFDVKRITRKEALLLNDKNDKFYVIFHDKLDKQRKNELNKYFSEVVLGNYFYAVANEKGKIKEMFWDKP